jgi:hypothetical protein
MVGADAEVEPMGVPALKPRELTREEARALLDEQARQYFGIGADEFIARWDRGEFSDEDACPEAVGVAMLLPLAR